MKVKRKARGKYLIHRNIKKVFYELKLDLINRWEDDPVYEELKFLLDQLDLAIDEVTDIREIEPQI